MRMLTKKLLSISIICCIICFVFPATLFAQDSYIAIPTNSKVLVYGKPISLGAYNIDGNNYFKLRDLAMALSESNKCFDVYWSEGYSNSVIYLQSKTPIKGSEIKTTTIGIDNTDVV